MAPRRGIYGVDEGIRRLMKGGYTKFTVAIKFLVKKDGSGALSTLKVSANGNVVLDTSFVQANNTSWEEHTVDGGIIPIGSFNNLLLVEWGYISVAYSSRTITIRAVKP
jgi:hypothetical protein